MITVLKHGEDTSKMNDKLANLLNSLKPKGVRVEDFIGKIDLKKDALKVQRDLRNEW